MSSTDNTEKFAQQVEEADVEGHIRQRVEDAGTDIRQRVEEADVEGHIRQRNLGPVDDSSELRAP